MSNKLNLYVWLVLLFLPFIAGTNALAVGQATSSPTTVLSPLYDTPSGRVELGDYAPNGPGSYIYMAVPTATSSTSTATQLFYSITPPLGFTLVHIIGTTSDQINPDGTTIVTTQTAPL